MSYYEMNSQLQMGLTGIVLTGYEEATQDVIPLLDHEKESIRLAAISACAALNIKEALPLLKVKAKRLKKEWTAYESGQSQKRFYEIETVYQEFAAVHFVLALWDEDVSFPLVMMSTTYGTGVMGLLGCSLPLFDQTDDDQGEAKSFLYLADEIMQFRYLADFSLWRGFMTIPHFWQRLIAQDLARVAWLEERDRQVLLTSLKLMEIQFYIDMPVFTPPANLPEMNEAVEQIAMALALSEDNNTLFEHIALTVEHLEQALEKRLLTYSFIRPANAALPAIFQELFFEDDNILNVTWQALQVYMKDVTNAYHQALTSDSFSFYVQPEQIQIAFLLILSGERYIQEIFKDTPDFVWVDEPDTSFFADLYNFGDDVLMYEAIHLWGIGMIQLLQKVYKDNDLGIEHLAKWRKKVLGLSTWVHIPKTEYEPSENSRFLKKNPLASVFQPFQ